MALNVAEFWVQIYNLPAGYVSEKVIESVGNYIGVYIKPDKACFDGSWKQFVRVRVAIDISKPLKRRLKLKKEGGEWLGIDFKYERLPTFCFLCGLIGHAEKFCPKLFDICSEDVERPYGAWLRAGGRRSLPSSGHRWLVPDSPIEREKWKAPSAEDNHAYHGKIGVES